MFYSSLGHDASTWDNRDVAQMYFEAIKWALGLTDGDATPRPLADEANDTHSTWSRTAVADVGALALVVLSAQDWPSRGGDPGEQRFSPLTQITPANVALCARRGRSTSARRICR